MKVKEWLIGSPVATQDEAHTRVGVATGLAVLSSDPISSVAYSTEAILLILVLGGPGAIRALIPIVGVLFGLLTILVLSYRQTIKAYPEGGGAYKVAKENLNKFFGLLAGSSLLADYVLTAAVSIAAGFNAVVSALKGVMFHGIDLGVWCGEHKAAFGVTVLVIIMLANLRGISETGKFFAIPTYAFAAMFGLVIVIGLVRYANGAGQLPAPLNPAFESGMDPIDLQVVGKGLQGMFFLRAFAAGCTALTGVEATSNGVSLFTQPSWKNAVKSLTGMYAIMVSLIIGSAIEATLIHALPNKDETVASMLGKYAFGTSPAYYFFQVTTMLILFLAANTAYQDFPRLGALMARDGFLPRQLMSRGDKLAYSNGIFVLTALAAVLIIAFKGEEQAMLPLYALGVFVGFTLSQFGMVRKTWRELHSTDPEVRKNARVWSLVINGLGGITTSVVLVVILVTKWHEGAWIVFCVIATLSTVFYAISVHYDATAKKLSLNGSPGTEAASPIHVLLLAGGVNRATVHTVAAARAIDPMAEAVFVELDPSSTEQMKKRWSEKFGGQLTVLHSPYRSLTSPIIGRIRDLNAEGKIVHLVVGELVLKGFWPNLLHNQSTLALRWALRVKGIRVVVTVVPFHLDEPN